MHPTIPFAAAALLLLAGCLAPPNAEDPSERPRESRTGGEMTAAEERQDESGVCGDGLPLDDRGGFCATRTITISGTLRGFSLLDVDLETFNGNVVVKDAADGRWGLVATLRARGATAAEASARLEEIRFTWSHEDAKGHFVAAAAEHEGPTRGHAADLELSMPRSLAMRLVGATSNGDVRLEGGRTDGLALSTSNGDVVARGDATQVDLATSNGEIDAQLRPTASGRWSATTSNGRISLAVPEGEAYGYSIDGTTSNGEVSYSLRDGAQGDCPAGSQYYTPPCTHRSFTSHRFDARPIQVRVDLVTSNGDVSAAPS